MIDNRDPYNRGIDEGRLDKGLGRPRCLSMKTPDYKRGYLRGWKLASLQGKKSKRTK